MFVKYSDFFGECVDFAKVSVSGAAEMAGDMWDFVKEHPVSFAVGGASMAAGVVALGWACHNAERAEYTDVCEKYNKTEYGVTECVDGAVAKYREIRPTFRKEHGFKKNCVGSTGKTTFVYRCDNNKKADSLARASVRDEIILKYDLGAKGIDF